MPEVKITNLKEFVEVLGEDLLVAFCQCFVHADRLLSLASWPLASSEKFGGDSVAYSRDLNTMFFFTLGTLHEAITAVENLEAAGIEGRIATNSCWPELRELAKAWKEFPRSAEMRNTLGFHVDKNTKLMRRGLERLIQDGEEVEFMKFDGEANVNWQLSFGLNVLFAGMRFAKTMEDRDDMDEEERELRFVGQLIKAVNDGHTNFFRLVHELIAEVATEAGISFVPLPAADGK